MTKRQKEYIMESFYAFLLFYWVFATIVSLSFIDYEEVESIPIAIFLSITTGWFLFPMLIGIIINHIMNEYIRR